MAGSTILVPVNAAEPPTVDPELVELLAPIQVVVLGYYPVPDQAATEQYRDEFEAEAAPALDRLVEAFGDVDGEVESVLVFTHDRGTSVDRVADEHDSDAILIPGEFDGLDRLLVPIRDDRNLARIATFVADLLRDTDAAVTLFHATDEDATTSEFLLRGVADRLRDEGIERDRIALEQAATESTVGTIVELAEEHDVVVIGETKPSLRERILGDVPSRIIDRTGRSVIVIRDTG